MCGIAGIIAFEPDWPVSRPVVEEMSRRIQARGPDGSGFWSEAGIALAHRRLAILDLSPAGAQPMHSACGRYVISFNGEIYNFADVAKELGLSGKLRSRSDTEVLVEAWARWGPECLDRLVGQFAFAIVDRETREFWIARDRFGEKPIFYHADGERLCFASSIAALLAVPSVPRELDHEALAEFATLRYVVAPRTILKDVRKLPPGQLLHVKGSGFEVRRWYRIPAFAEGPTTSPGEITERFDHLLRQATDRCLISDVPVGMFLSDGIDSHAIAEAAHRPVDAYSYVHESHRGALNIDYPTEMVRVSEDTRYEDFDACSAALLEPIGDGAALATWQLVRAARERTTVFLCGHGGDEVTGGYRIQKDLLRLQSLWPWRFLPAPLARPFADRWLLGTEDFGKRWRRWRSSTKPESPAAARTLVQGQLPTADLQQLLDGRAVDTAFDSVDRLYDETVEGSSILDRIQQVMLQTFLTENLMSFCDATGMAWSTEIRTPFLDRDLVEFVLTLPPDERVRRHPGRQSTKLVLRRWAKDRLSDAVITRKKSGFTTGNITGLLDARNGELRSRMLDLGALRDAMPGLEAWLQRDAADFRGPREGTLWALVTLGSWYAQLPANERPAADEANAIRT